MLLVCFFTLLVALCDAQKAIASIVAQSSSTVTGYITFTTSSLGVSVNVSLSGLGSRTSVAIHVHTFGDLSSQLGPNDGLSAGGHYVGAGSTTHGCPGINSSRHGGDMGSWTVTNGAINVVQDFDLLILTGIYSILGRAVVVHDLADACTGATGNAGGRLGVGIIGMFDDSTISTSTNLDPSVTSAIAVFDSGSAVYFTQESGGILDIIANVTLAPGSVHGIHIHQYGNLVKDAYAGSGGHYNPLGVVHGFPNELIHHYGDLGNIMYYSGSRAWYHYKTLNTLSLNAIIGRSVIIHSGADHGSGAGCDTATGSSGTKQMMAVIGVMNTATVKPTLPVDVVFVNDWEPESCLPPPTPEPEPDFGTMVGPSLALGLALAGVVIGVAY